MGEEWEQVHNMFQCVSCRVEALWWDKRSFGEKGIKAGINSSITGE